MHSQSTAVNTFSLNSRNNFAKHLSQAPVNAVLFLIAKPSEKKRKASKRQHHFCLELPKLSVNK